MGQILKKLRKHLNIDTMLSHLHKQFAEVDDPLAGKADIPIADVLMSGFAMFSLKDPSLLAFDARRTTDSNLNQIYHIGTVPSDTCMRTRLDEINPEDLRPLYKNSFYALQRGKALEPFVFMDGCYLLSLDGTGYFSSDKIHCECCLEKINKRTKQVTYSHQMLGAAIVHPDLKTVIPFSPEPIIKQDGTAKNDCERNASKRFIEKLRKDHPFLKLIITEDALSSNAPHIMDLQHHNLHYILGVKKGDHSFLFEYVERAHKNGETTEMELEGNKVLHRFRYLNQVPLNASNPDLLVNFLEYWEIKPNKKMQHFCWVTDFTLRGDNVFKIMRGGRARWKIENETFNTLKNQGYHFEHNFGHGNKNLSVVFASLMMLAFLIDQIQQLTCSLFQAILKKVNCKRRVWEQIRSFIQILEWDSMTNVYKAILYGRQAIGFEIFDKSP